MSKRHAVIIAMGLLASASALAQTETTGQAGPKPAAPSGTVHNSVTGGTYYGPVMLGHTFTNSTFHTRDGRQP